MRRDKETYNYITYSFLLSLAGAGANIFFFFVAANILSRKTRVCGDKHVFCPDQSVLASTKIILVAAPANDNFLSVTALKQHRGRRLVQHRYCRR